MGTIATPRLYARLISLVVSLTFITIGPANAQLPPDVGGTWGPIIDWPHVPVSMANLPDGRVLTWASNERNRFPAGPEFSYAATWDPQTGEFIELPHPSHDMFCASLVMDEHGRVFVTGGRNQGNSPWTSVFDYRHNTWTHLENMNRGRWYPTSVALPTGQVFIAVGIGGGAEPDLYTPGSGWELLTGINLSEALLDYGSRDGANMWPLIELDPRGDLFLHGATPGMWTLTTEGLGSITSLGDHGLEWFPDEGVSIMYREGKILVAGGSAHIGTNVAVPDAVVFDVNGPAPVITPVAPMNFARQFQNEVMLPNGHVLVVGGNTSGVKFTDANGVLQPESWDPDTDTWTLHNPQAEARNYHSTGVLLTDGTVLSAGGGLNGNANVDHWNGEIFYPPYLYLPDGSLAPRPSITSGPDLMRTGGTYTFTATPGVPHWSLIKMSATTHTMNTDQRYLPVSFEETAAGTYALSLHNNVNVLTPGFWMLFAVDAAGVPSVSAVVQIVTTGAPRAVAPPEQFNRVGDAIELTIEARDPDGDPIGFVANGLPPGLEMDPVTGVIAGVVAEAGIFDVTVIIDDGTDLAVLAFRWLVTSRSNNSEFGRETDDHSANQWHPVQLTKLYFDPVVVMGPLTINGADPTTMRVRNVGGNGFEWAMDEWDYKDGSHTTETVSWLAVDAGTYQLPNGSTLLASHTAAVDTGWSAVAFEPGTFAEVPLILPQVVSAEGGEAVTVRLRNITVEGFELRLQEQESGDDVVSPEQVDWIAIEPGVLEGELEAGLLAAADESDSVVNYATAFVTPPDFFAAIQTFDEADPVALRLRSSIATAATFFLEEEASLDAELDHLNEAVAWLAVGADVEDLPLVRLDNSAPQVTDPGQQVSLSGAQVSLFIDASDPDGDPMSFAAQGLPDGLSIDAFTGEIGGTAGTPGLYAVTVTVTDNFEAAGQVSFDWHVSEVVQLLPFATPPALVGSTVDYTALSNFGGDFDFDWDFGDGNATSTNSPATSHVFAAPGRYVLTIGVTDTLTGLSDSIQLVQLVHAPVIGSAASAAGAVALDAVAGRLWVANPDNDTVTVLDASTYAKLAEVAVGASPRSVAVGAQAWVANKHGDSITVIDPVTFAVLTTHDLPRGSRPHALLFDGSATAAYVGLEGLGQVLRLDPGTGAVEQTYEVGPDPRGLAFTADGTSLLVSRFVTPRLPGEAGVLPQVEVAGVHYGGEVVPIDLVLDAVQAPIVLQHSFAEATEHSGPGIPNYLGAPVVAPSGMWAWVPSKQDNILDGAGRSGALLDFDSTVRAISSVIDLGPGSERLGARIDHDDASIASAAVMDPTGSYLFVALEGNRQIAIVDAIEEVELGRFDCGRAPQGLAIAADGRTLYVHNFMDRSVTVHDVSNVLDYGSVSATLLATVDLVADEQLGANVLNGKQLFYDARDPRLSSNVYMACAACHNDGADDGRIWDFTQFGEGVRNTVSLNGRGVGHGPLHWTANFDELQDFEGQIRNFGGGLGLMSDADFEFGTRSDPLGDPKAGLSQDLDDLAAYFASLTSTQSSPHKLADGSLTLEAQAGEQLFGALGCGACHGGQPFTDSAQGVKHDVGTLGPASGAGAAAGLDTPTLRDLWTTAPYLHDGSATTVGEAIEAHVVVDAAERDALEAYVLSLDDDEDAANASCVGAVCVCDAGFYEGAAGCTPCGAVPNCVGAVTCTTSTDSVCEGCAPGFEGPECSDIDECALGTDACDTNAACSNTPGGYTCACNAGYTGDGVSCEDVDECAANSDNCSDNGACTNTPGGFTCACNAGYAGDGVSCDDVDECAGGSDDCSDNGACTNTPGSFTCACNAGYTGDGVSCEDVDECTAGTDDCGANATCSNTPGGFTCACDSGYSGDGVTCEDVDECAAGSDDCSEDGICVNTPGAFTCACNPGYTGDGVSCDDVDECAAGTDDCAVVATCTNTPGGFTCACNPGFEGDGRVCEPVGPYSEFGSVYIQQQNFDVWHAVAFQNSYQSPVVVMGTPTRRGGQPMTTRIRNVTPQGFEWQMQEWEYLDGYHTQETITWMVVEAGAWTLPGGGQLRAGVHEGVGSGWSTVDTGGFAGAPVLLTQAAERSVEGALVTRHRNVGANSFQVRLQGSEARGYKTGHTHIGTARTYWVALDTGVQAGAFEAGITGDLFTHSKRSHTLGQTYSANPLIFGQMQRQDGGDTATLRTDGITTNTVSFRVEEEKSANTEVKHTKEPLGVVAIDPGLASFGLTAAP